ncbi:MAG TPA: type III pantothenate kinase, partial [Alphaproteobacteria bacterium]|nr:type III pantothenate kinase [Alphaproteobacteria bacterium]
MLLAIDAGNTNIVFAFLKDGNIDAQFRASTKDARTSDEYYVWLTQLLTLHDLKASEITGAVIATVVPQALFNLRVLCRKFFKVEPLVVGEPGCQLGIGVKTLRPEAVGADRLADAVAGHKLYGGPLIILDFGTATTFNVVSENGDYEGGVIAPGVNLSLEALHLAAAKLPSIAIERPAKVIGRDTVPAMQSGVFWGYVSMIEGMVARIRSEYGKPMKVVATGGLANLFRNTVGIFDVTDPDITIRGLAEIHSLNHAD